MDVTVEVETADVGCKGVTALVVVDRAPALLPGKVLAATTSAVRPSVILATGTSPRAPGKVLASSFVGTTSAP